MAGYLRRELGRDIAMVHGGYGEFKVLVDDDVVIDAGAAAALGIVPSSRRILGAVRARLKNE